MGLIAVMVLLLIFLRSKRSQRWLRELVESRWQQPARIVNTLAGAGVLAGLMSFGNWIIALILFPLAIAACVKLVLRWEWLDRRIMRSHTEMRRPLHLLYVAAAAPLLMTWPLFQLWMLVAGFVAFPIGIGYRDLRPGLGQGAEENFMLWVGMALGVLLYCGLLNIAFLRLTGRRFRALAWQFVGWIFLLMLCLWLLDSAFGIQDLPEFKRSMPLLLTAIVTAYLLKQAGSVLGKWLARSTAAT